MELAKVVEKYNIYNLVRTRTVNIRLNFCVNNGDISFEMNDPRDVLKFNNFISRKLKCESCGKYFDYKSTKRNLSFCDECQKNKRSKDRHKNKNRRLNLNHAS